MALNFVRCDDEFKTIEEEFNMSINESIKNISSWISKPYERSTRIDRELAMLKEYTQRRDQIMLSIGTKVIVHTCKEYGGRLTGKVGVVSQLYPRAHKVGVSFDDAFNSESGTGVFWLPDKSVTPYAKATPILDTSDVRKVIFNENKTIVLWKDGTKTIVTCEEDDCFDPYAGFCAAVVKRVFGSTSNAKRILKKNAKNMPEGKTTVKNAETACGEIKDE